MMRSSERGYVRIDRVTMTGADESVDPAELKAITRDFPFVEWGILFSPNRQGAGRYPSPGWVRQFLSFDLPCAAHVCGAATDEFAGESSPRYGGFGRVQMNFNLKAKPYLLSKLPHVVEREGDRPVIFQLNQANQQLGSCDFATSILFDASGGRGVAPEGWPRSLEGRYCGYAGGLGPDTLSGQLMEIDLVAGDRGIWIDMEGKVRSDGDRFDLGKVITCLEVAAPYVAKLAA